MKTKPAPLTDAKARLEMKKILSCAARVPVLRGPLQGVQPPAITLVGNAAMTRLNHKYRGKNKTTDVLSFSAHPVFAMQGVLGELVISLPVLNAQARERTHAPSKELSVLVIHGLLHLLGFDHELGPKEAQKMSKLEEQILKLRYPERTKPKGLIHRT